MLQCLFSRSTRRFGLCGFLAVLFGGVGASSALASTTPVDTSACSAPTLSQSLFAAGDSNWYTMAPGESPDSFAGGGWSLSGGASIITTQLADGATGSVLDLPSGATAVSPVICVSADYPTARMQVRDLVGSEGVSFNVEYAGTKTATAPKNTGQVHGQQTGWTLSTPVNLQPEKSTGWQLLQIVLAGKGTTSHFQVYNLYIDPRCSH